MLKVYTYAGCTTCRNATKWLRERELPFQEIAIRTTPPTLPELSAMLAAQGGSVRNLCNTSGLDYRALGLKDTLPSMAPEAVLSLLHSNGNLVKRPFAIDEEHGIFLLGFKEASWMAAFA